MTRRFIMNDSPVYPIPQPQSPMPTAEGFVYFFAHQQPGLTREQWAIQQMLYQLAYEQAQAVARPSLPERDLLGVWN